VTRGSLSTQLVSAYIARPVVHHCGRASVGLYHSFSHSGILIQSNNHSWLAGYTRVEAGVVLFAMRICAGVDTMELPYNLK